MNTPLVLTVTQLNKYIKSNFDADEKLYNIFLCGEISNFTNHYRTGHFYFTLKDDSSAVRAVMFRSNAERIKFLPEDGLKVIVRGRVSVYEATGQYQVYADDMQPDGVGALNLAYEQLKEKLAAEGLFDLTHKKQLPRFPRRVGVITSPTGAAVQDILQILGRRFPLAEVVFCPALVQGKGAAEQLIQAIELLNTQKAADVIIIGRGGGSIEDLWEFNNEKLARTIYLSEIPVVSAVGHETDYTICDFVADLRAPTPSAAAEMVVPDCNEQAAYLLSLKNVLISSVSGSLRQKRAELTMYCSKPCFKTPLNAVNLKRMALDSKCARLAEIQSGRVYAQKMQYSKLTAALSALNPLAVLARGFSAVSSADGNPVCTAASVSVGDKIFLRFSDGTAQCIVEEIS